MLATAAWSPWPGLHQILMAPGIIVDGLNALAGHKSLFYAHYHHYLLHGWLAGAILAGLAACLASDKFRVALLVILVFHLHLLFDFVGSRGSIARRPLAHLLLRSF